jgi:hypothetical protein
MRNVAIKEYLLTYKTNPSNLILEALKANDSFPDKPFDLNVLTYNEIRQINRKLKAVKDLSDYISILSIAYRAEEFEVLDLPIINFFEIKKFINEKILSLLEKEAKILSNADGDADMWRMAGGDALKQYADILPLDRLAKLYGGYPLDYGEKKYVEIIYLLAMNAMHDKVDRKFYELKNPNN